jgi:hypothetical protein
MNVVQRGNEGKLIRIYSLYGTCPENTLQNMNSNIKPIESTTSILHSDEWNVK